jgi:hypothetical protein
MSVDDAEQSGSEGAQRGLDLSSLLQGSQRESDEQGAGSAGLAGLGGLLSGLLNQGTPDVGSAGQLDLDDAGLAEGMGISPSVAQAALALVMGSLLRGGSAEGSKSGGLAGQLAQLGDQPLDEEAVKATGLPGQLARNTGLDLPKAIQTVQQILEMLRKATKPLGSAAASKPSTSTAKKRRRKTTSSTRPKAKPKKTTSSARPKAKPKKTTSSARPKAKPKKTSTSKTTKRRKTTAKGTPAK